jgi:xanthosine utilization system XapX-like protein
MAEKSLASHRNAVDRVLAAQGFAVDLPVVGRVRIPRPEHLAYYGALGALVAAEIIEWPVALVLVTGHWLVQNQHNRLAHQVGEALEEA